MHFNFQNTFSNLPDKFYTKTYPEKALSPKKILINKELSELLNLDFNYLNSEEGIDILSGTSMPEGSEPLAMVYAGHQFGNWVSQLGDGRAILLGEVKGKNNQVYDIQLKGSGKTPYSRGGDGKAWLGPVIREYLVSEYMHKIGIPTTRSLSAILTGENVYREEIYPGAVLCRVAKSHIRVGTFQYFYSKKDKSSLKLLADYFIERNLPFIENDNKKYLNFFTHVVENQIKLITSWMKVGFIHGVMNTDNTSISCETIDYGPCAFMDVYKNDKVFSSIDTMGRYSYKNQPHIIMWNMSCFASAILPLLKGNVDKNIEKLQEIISNIPNRYKENWITEFRKKLGLNKKLNSDEKVINTFLQILEKEKLDFTNSFSSLQSCMKNKKTTIISQTTDFLEWKAEWLKRIRKEKNLDDVEKTLTKNNPQIIIRNHIVENIIEEMLSNKYNNLYRLLEAMDKPFEKTKKYNDFYATPSKKQEVTQTFCGT